MESGWRIEVNKNGKQWNWRKGSKQNRQSRYGGTFETLSESRKRDYEHNKQKEAARRETIKARRAGHSIERVERVS